jgi:phosphate:Na+ symporter
MSQQMTLGDTEWLLNQQKRQELLTTLDQACFELWDTARNVGPDLHPLRETVVEAVDLFLLTAVAGMAGGDAGELAMLETMTRNHGAAMERVRKKYLALADALPPDERNRILQITSIFERIAWSAGRFAALLAEAPTMAEQPAPHAA